MLSATRCWITKVAVIAAFGLAAAPTDAQDRQWPGKPRPQPARLSQEEARAQLEAKLPSWNADELRRSPSAAVWEAPSRPREFAAKFIEAEMSFVERRAGRDIYGTADEEAFVMANAERGLFSVLQNPAEDATDTNVFSLDRAVEVAREIFRTAGASEVEQGEVIKTDVMQGSPGEKPEVVARHVRFHRAANGLRVRDSLWMVTFDLEGKPFRIEAKWPQFKLATGELRAREDVLRTLNRDLATRSGSDIGVSKVEVDLAYQQVEGSFEPVVSLWVFSGTGFGSPDLIQFSLVRGLISDLSVSKSDPQTDS